MFQKKRGTRGKKTSVIFRQYVKSLWCRWHIHLPRSQCESLAAPCNRPSLSLSGESRHLGDFFITFPCFIPAADCHRFFKADPHTHTSPPLLLPPSGRASARPTWHPPAASSLGSAGTRRLSASWISSRMFRSSLRSVLTEPLQCTVTEDMLGREGSKNPVLFCQVFLWKQTFLDADWVNPQSINILSKRNVDVQLHWLPTCTIVHWENTTSSSYRFRLNTCRISTRLCTACGARR